MGTAHPKAISEPVTEPDSQKIEKFQYHNFSFFSHDQHLYNHDHGEIKHVCQKKCNYSWSWGNEHSFVEIINDNKRYIIRHTISANYHHLLYYDDKLNFIKRIDYPHNLCRETTICKMDLIDEKKCLIHSEHALRIHEFNGRDFRIFHHSGLYYYKILPNKDIIVIYDYAESAGEYTFLIETYSSQKDYALIHTHYYTMKGKASYDDELYLYILPKKIVQYYLRQKDTHYIHDVRKIKNGFYVIYYKQGSFRTHMIVDEWIEENTIWRCRNVLNVCKENYYLINKLLKTPFIFNCYGNHYFCSILPESYEDWKKRMILFLGEIMKGFSSDVLGLMIEFVD